MRTSRVRMGLFAACGRHASAYLKSGAGVDHGGRLASDFFADLLVECRVIIEIKAARAFVKEHEVLLVNYLTGSKIDDGLEVNWGPLVQITQKYRHPQKRVGKH